MTYPLPGSRVYSAPKRTDDGSEAVALEGTPFHRDGMLTLVLEEYFPGFRFKGARADFAASDPHHLVSVTKNLTRIH
jgi:hypothetical protein